ncbi:hypothetical protein C3920_10560 [Novacetimonas pomaceti]|uniref:Uncharacterized protein n=1 Tax=Novacetimonas pomaceti TaxID=2021998 RepID=A0ABX5P306_9PROT|nr:hypothetical protein C3920_10560 [Novacetimonas pomaceti]
MQKASKDTAFLDKGGTQKLLPFINALFSGTLRNRPIVWSVPVSQRQPNIHQVGGSWITFPNPPCPSCPGRNAIPGRRLP